MPTPTTFANITSTLTGGPGASDATLPGTAYNDPNVTAASTYCYYVTMVLGGVEGGPSNLSGATIGTAGATGLGATPH